MQRVPLVRFLHRPRTPKLQRDPFKLAKLPGAQSGRPANSTVRASGSSPTAERSGGGGSLVYVTCALCKRSVGLDPVVFATSVPVKLLLASCSATTRQRVRSASPPAVVVRVGVVGGDGR